MVEPICASVQVDPGVLKAPAAPATEPGPSRVKLTVPCGKLLVPESVSDTVAVQTEPWLSATGVAQLTTVEVERLALKVAVTD